MTIRETIDGLMADPGEQDSFQNDREAFLDEHGLGDLPPELVDTAFVHYSDSATIEQADVLAPLVTRVGPVPYEETDLPDGVTDELGEGASPDPWAMVAFDTVAAPAVEPEQDPADLDDTINPPEAPVVENTTESPEFGAGETSIGDGFDDVDLGDDPFIDDAPSDTPAAELVEPVLEEPTTDYADDIDALNDGFSDAVGDSIEEDIDPAELDFD